MSIPSTIQKDHVLVALRQLDQMTEEEIRPSTKFDLVYQDRRYPPKEVLRYANYEANGYELRKFGGGDESNNFLIRLGFHIALKYSNEFIELDYTKKKRKGIQATYTVNQPTPKVVLPSTFIDEVENEEVTETEREHLTKVRIAQSLFKKRLLEQSSQCMLCGMDDKRFLIASHIKPWRESSHEERVDVHNGLLLCPNHDTLFDKGYISFDKKEGKILISEELDIRTRMLMNIVESFKMDMSKKQGEYMEWHRENVFTEYPSHSG